MAEVTKSEVREVRASARRIHISPRKARLVVDVLRDLTVGQALEQLQFLTGKAVKPIRKLVDSAVANASHNFQIDADQLFIKSFTVDGAEVFTRFRPRAQGRAFPVRKRTSHLNLILGVRPGVVKSKKKVAEAPKVEEKALAERGAEKVEKIEEQKPRFNFFRRRSRGKEITKGKRYTGFDRRSGS